MMPQIGSTVGQATFATPAWADLVNMSDSTTAMVSDTTPTPRSNTSVRKTRPKMPVSVHSCSRVSRPLEAAHPGRRSQSYRSRLRPGQLRLW